MAPIKGRKSAANKNLPVLSHEFVIQNHADIVSCVAMVIVIGLMVQVSGFVGAEFLPPDAYALGPDGHFVLRPSIKISFFFFFFLSFQLTSPVSSLFVALQYAQAAEQNQNVLQTYGTGLKDLFAIFFYFLICIIFHAIIQEYVLDVSHPRRLFAAVVVNLVDFIYSGDV